MLEVKVKARERFLTVAVKKLVEQRLRPVGTLHLVPSITNGTLMSNTPISSSLGKLWSFIQFCIFTIAGWKVLRIGD